MNPTVPVAHPVRSGGTVALVLATWFVLVLAASILGLFDSAPRPPGPLGAAAVLPVIGFALGYRWSMRVREVVLFANPVLLTLAQTWRIGAIVFLVLHARGMLPGVFALPAGWGDIAVGATAPLVAWLLARRRLPRAVFQAWHIVGIADLALAITLGVLASNTPLGVLADDATTRVMGQFPMSLIPTFFVPLLAILHLAALWARPLTTPVRAIEARKLKSGNGL